jgi:DNA polymerase-3 subunit gamma/tau
MAALRGDRTAHAYLFSGPRGCGKTTSARILARCLNCAAAPTDTPCGTCDSCRELALGGSGSLDVVEMDAASHGGVDDARELVERASFAPARDRYKIFIIDEAHMVTNQGFNALLKLVEEPPPHVKFIFATTEPEKVIGTIRSRTHHYPFRLVPPNTLEQYLAKIAEQEGISVGAGVLPLVVRAGGGSVRDSLSVLDQLIGGTDGSELRYADAIALLGYTDSSLLDDATEAIAADDGATLFSVVDRVVQSGHDPRRFVEDLLQRLRDIIVIAISGDAAADVFDSVPADQYKRMQLQAEHMGAGRASRSADLVNEALAMMVGATSPRLQLELLCARLLLVTGQGNAAHTSGAAPAVATGARNAAAPGGRPAQARAAQDTHRTAPHVERAPQNVVAERGVQRTSRRPGKIVSPQWAAAPEEDAAGSAHTNPTMPSESTTPEASTTHEASTAEQAERRADEARDSGAPASGINVPDAGVQVSDGAAAPAAEGTSKSETEGAVPLDSADAAAHPEAARGGVDTAARGGVDTAAYGGVDTAIIRQRWNEVIAAVMAAHARATAALIKENAQIGSYHDGLLTLLFKSNGLAATFNQPRHTESVAAALHDVLGIDARVTATVGGGERPKEEAAPEAAPEPSPDEAPVRASETEPAAPVMSAQWVVPAKPGERVAAIGAEPAAPADSAVIASPEDSAAAGAAEDPAGVLAQLLDDPHAGLSQEAAANPPHRTGADAEEEPGGGQNRDTEQGFGILEAEPFYAQTMPTPPSLAQMKKAHHTSDGRSTQPSAEPHAPSAASPEVSSPNPAASASIPEEDEVSPDDPTVEQSHVVGIDVVLETLSGVIIEEIPNQGSEGGAQ